MVELLLPVRKYNELHLAKRTEIPVVRQLLLLEVWIAKRTVLGRAGMLVTCSASSLCRIPKSAMQLLFLCTR